VFGVNVNRVFDGGLSNPNWGVQLGAVQASGITRVRSDALWPVAEPSAPLAGIHLYDWRDQDLIESNLAGHGLDWLPILDYAPAWAARDPTYPHSPPRSSDDYAAYAAAFAGRYGRGGSFWRERPDVRYTPVTTYEIWNEEDNPAFWEPAPEPAVYADLYVKARAAIRSVDPQAVVLVGGLLPDTAFVDAMYRARPGLAGAVDAVAIHPYAASPYDVFREVRELRATLDAAGGGSPPLYVTELGWVTHGDSPLLTTDAQRAANLSWTSDWLARSDCGIRTVMPYTWTTPERNPSDPEDWYGIYGWHGHPTASSDAYARVVARWSSDPAGAAAGPPVCHGRDRDGDGYADVFDACPANPLAHTAPCPPLAVTERVSARRAMVRSRLRYAVEVTNEGGKTERGLTVTGRIAGARLTAVRARAACDRSTCALAPLRPAATATVTFVVEPLRPGRLTAIATVAGDRSTQPVTVAASALAVPYFAGVRIAARSAGRVAVACPPRTAGGCFGTLALERARAAPAVRLALRPGERVTLRLGATAAALVADVHDGFGTRRVRRMRLRRR
jgi:hypothetical protein